MSGNGFSHIDEDGEVRMVNVGGKETTRRTARATARIRMSAETIRALEDRSVPKGDVFATARIAGILGAKKTSELIPLTHPIPLDHVDIDFSIERPDTVVVSGRAGCEGRTGVEIEAMTACSIAALTIYDMCKSFDRHIVITDLKLEEKTGGRSGHWRREDNRSDS